MQPGARLAALDWDDWGELKGSDQSRLAVVTGGGRNTSACGTPGESQPPPGLLHYQFTLLCDHSSIATSLCTHDPPSTCVDDCCLTHPPVRLPLPHPTLVSISRITPVSGPSDNSEEEHPLPPPQHYPCLNPCHSKKHLRHDSAQGAARTKAAHRPSVRELQAAQAEGELTNADVISMALFRVMVPDISEHSTSFNSICLHSHLNSVLASCLIGIRFPTPEIS
ncbi:uncharacterized protein BDR25DRAFT_348841 [Lindgomyces ingoldianus]|uniref:Uncharacterized protein n=1 Tax=Lindgomyces ingoldianus TaxID=673940 RepID=A0ACB6RF12_9PLEO|nr:uncharacterized protein BDR25DRAFT_348841 [Lindgomyces ingoldianus]KAF2476917.1 hypothetical protein BDR25DRAFT_348841 [Lindgomyces ingoldianus]